MSDSFRHAGSNYYDLAISRRSYKGSYRACWPLTSILFYRASLDRQNGCRPRVIEFGPPQGRLTHYQHTRNYHGLRVRLHFHLLIVTYTPTSVRALFVASSITRSHLRSRVDLELGPTICAIPNNCTLSLASAHPSSLVQGFL